MARLPLDVIQDLTNALLDAFPSRGELSRFADVHLEINLERLGGNNLDEMVHHLVREMEATGRTRELVDKAEGANHRVALAGAARNVRNALDRAVAATWYQPPPDPVQTCFVRGGRAFIDREDLRTSLQQLIGPDSATLVVRGDPKTGNSYSLRLVAYICEAYGYRIAHLNLDEHGTTFGPEDLTRTILRQMGRSSRADDLLARESQVARWIVELRELILSEIRDSGETWWIVIDGVDPGTASAETLDLVKQLVIAAEQYTHPLRVVLLDCLEPVPPEVEPYVEKEDIRAIELAMLEDFFTQVAHHRGEDPDRRAIERIVKEVAKLAPGGVETLDRLGAAVSRVARSLPE